MTDRWITAEVEALRTQNEELRTRIEALQGEFDVFVLPGEELLSLTGIERALAKILFDRHGVAVRKDGIHTILYGLRGSEETPDPKIIDVLVCNLRAKLRDTAYEIVTAWGHGYALKRKTVGEAAA